MIYTRNYFNSIAHFGRTTRQTNEDEEYKLLVEVGP